MCAQPSYVCNPTPEPYVYQSIPDRLRCLATEDPEHVAFIFYNFDGRREAITGKELYQHSELLAKQFVNLGMRKGSWVGICMNNSINTLYAIHGVALAGGIPFFLATNLKDGSDLAETINDMKCEFLIIDASNGDANWKILDKIWPMNEVKSAAIQTLRYIVCNGSAFSEQNCRFHLGNLMETPVPEEIELPQIFPEEVLLCFCTSGSTGKPKLVLWTHFAILNWTLHCDSRDFTKDMVYFCERPFGWAGGFPRLYITTGCVQVFVDTRMTLSGKYVNQVCDIIEAETVETAYIPRYIAMDLLLNPHLAFKFKTVNVLLVGGERFSLALLPLKDTFCRKLVIWYGNTENGGSVSFCSDTYGDYEEGIIGLPAPGAEIKLIDESGNVVPIGEQGELCIRSTWRCYGYKNAPESLRGTIDNAGWFHSCDVAHIRPERNIVIDGRTQDLIMMQTVKYFPWDIEKTLRKCPGIKEATAVGVPDVRLNQVICACVVPEPDARETFTVEYLKQFCNENFMDEATSAGLSLKPRYYLIFDIFPLTSSGKLDRRRIAALAKERLCLQSACVCLFFFFVFLLLFFFCFFFFFFLFFFFFFFLFFRECGHTTPAPSPAPPR